VPPDSVRCTRGLHAELLTFEKIQRRSAIIHRTVRCTPDSVRCPQGRAALELASLGNSLCYNSLDCPVYTGLSGEPAEQRLLRANGHLQAHLMHARSAQKSGTRALAHRTLYSTCPVCHRTSRLAQKTELQRSEPNGLGDVAGAPDMSDVHRTVRCALRPHTSPTTTFWLVAINTTPTSHFNVWEPKQHSKSFS
jgi:hypothetical protein